MMQAMYEDGYVLVSVHDPQSRLLMKMAILSLFLAIYLPEERAICIISG